MLPRYSPLKAGARTRDNNAARAKVWPQIMARCSGACEGCGRKGLGLSWCHVYGRPGSGFCLGAWANTAQLTAALCDPCHKKLDRHLDVDLQYRLRDRAALFFARKYGFNILQVAHEFSLTEPGDFVRAMIRALEAAGQHPDGEVVASPKPSEK